MVSCDKSDDYIEPDQTPIEYVEFENSDIINCFDFIKEYTDNIDAIEFILVSIPEYPKSSEDRIYSYNLEKEVFDVEDIFNLNKDIDYDQNSELKFTLYLKVSNSDIPREKLSRGFYPVHIKITKK
jgi:hypothetical protein